MFRNLFEETTKRSSHCIEHTNHCAPHADDVFSVYVSGVGMLSTARAYRLSNVCSKFTAALPFSEVHRSP